ncbi:MAG: DNA-directed RNA polymerase subunit alpha [Candidatus Lindowbacteria bacterium RIFCSPLOWO2_12_FULL_62_27]|nr:MAG: DNA-directed RNA polymerase subunit alpha [Candidatus Lindowbacteria bacterium RIFCSPLOWO2_12_FULL_62_27]OGH63583.1 MAG: DNA-directed RNA polymerase subunit alpha [Candidatus Lindowbacteria bacterium RIFCSPLOWO2_02_FULL_62_12]
MRVVREEAGDFGRYEIQPLERGFGTTFGNSIRRVLLSSIVGAAPFAVKISTKSGAALHEFATLKGVVTDTLDILFNLKSLRLRMDQDGVVVLKAEKSGPAKILGKDLVPEDRSVEILNEDMLIAEVSEGGQLKIEIQTQLGRGYVPAENLDRKLEPGWIAIDSIYSPVDRVNFEVENTRVGQITDYDKLIMEIWTDGSITPRDALAHAAKVIKEHMQPFINFEEEEKILDEEIELTPEEKQLQKILSVSIEELELSVRSYNCLKSANIHALGELATKTEAELLKTRNFGRKSLMEIKDKLQQYNLELGMKGVSHLLVKSQTAETVEA